MAKATRGASQVPVGAMASKANLDLNEQQLKERDRVRSGILTDFQFLVVYDDAQEGEHAWGIIHRSDLDRDPPGVSAGMMIPQKTRKQKMPLMMSEEERPWSRYIFSRVEKGGSPCSLKVKSCLQCSFSFRVCKGRSPGRHEGRAHQVLRGSDEPGRPAVGGLLGHRQPVCRGRLCGSRFRTI